MAGYPWYTNGKRDIQIKSGNDVPEGFYKGRKSRSIESRLKQSVSEARAFKNMSVEKKEERRRKLTLVWNSRTDEEKLRIVSPMISKSSSNKLGAIPWNKGKHLDYDVWNKGRHVGSYWTGDSARKQYETRKLNNTFKIKDTIPENETYKVLLKYFSDNDIVHPYRDEDRYPFNCDFYIKSIDLFIEINYSWTHGKHPFNLNNEEDMKLLNKWKEKAKTSDYYKNAIETWTIRDVKKLNTAKANNLNYLVIYQKSSTTIENIILEEISKIRSK